MSSGLFPKAAFLQFQISLGDPDLNLEKLHATFIRLTPEPGTIIVLPELWATGFIYPRLAELAAATPRLLEKLHALARGHAVYFAGSLPEHDGDNSKFRIFNTLYLTGPDGLLGTYRKNRLFPPWRENLFFRAGFNPQPIATPHGDTGALICYDLRFPELARIQAAAGARLLVVSAQWPTVRLDHWRILLRARAIENQLFVAACNSCGRTGDFLIGGHSMIIAPDGTILAEAGQDEETGKAKLNGSLVDELRDKFCTVDIR